MADQNVSVGNHLNKKFVDMGDGTYAERVATVATPATPPAASTLTQGTVSVASSGDNTLVAAVALQTTRVFALALTFASPVDVILKDGSTTLAPFQGVTSLVLDPFAANPRFVCAVNSAFIINLSSAVACKGSIWYAQG